MNNINTISTVGKLPGYNSLCIKILFTQTQQSNEVFARGGIKDVLVSNQVRDPAKIDRLARMPKLGARTICCVDDLANVADLSAAAVKHGTTIECLVEIDGVPNQQGCLIEVRDGMKISRQLGLPGGDKQ